MRNWVIGTKQLASVRCSTTRNATTNQSHTISNVRCHRHRHCVKNYWLTAYSQSENRRKGAGQHLSVIRRVKLNLQSQTRLSGHFPRASRYCDESTRKLSQGPLHGSECRQQQQNARLVTQ